MTAKAAFFVSSGSLSMFSKKFFSAVSAISALPWNMFLLCLNLRNRYKFPYAKPSFSAFWVAQISPQILNSSPKVLLMNVAISVKFFGFHPSSIFSNSSRILRIFGKCWWLQLSARSAG